ncbi:hypothetical protein ACFYKT_16560 [Cytobacillus sp. FJAT-53684]|uniref:Uncharacterized protein n=1 Tax=Cytobacillus mangrovibacter TaxID=3299024 RepID=A0ABW6K3S3_9BACI
MFNKVVFFGKASKKWVAYLDYQGMHTPFKRFDTQEEAEAYLETI